MRIRKAQADVLESIGMKWCSGCNSAKFASDFFDVQSNKRMGLSVYCKSCDNVKKNKRKIQEGTSTKKQLTQSVYEEIHKIHHDYCPGCQRVLRFEKFGNDSRTKTGRFSYCKDCVKTRNARRHKIDKD